TQSRAVGVDHGGLALRSEEETSLCRGLHLRGGVKVPAPNQASRRPHHAQAQEMASRQWLRFEKPVLRVFHSSRRDPLGPSIAIRRLVQRNRWTIFSVNVTTPCISDSSIRLELKIQGATESVVAVGGKLPGVNEHCAREM